MIQRAVVKATAAIAKNMQEVLKARAKRTLTDKDVKDEVFKLNADALALLSHASKELSLKRRYAMRPHLPKSLIALCSDQVPITANLFGDNLASSLKEAKELDKLTNAAGPSGFQSSQYDRHRNKNWHTQDRKPFLGNRNRQYAGQQKQHFGGQQEPEKNLQESLEPLLLSDRQVRQNLISLPSLLAEQRTEVEFFKIQGGRLKQFLDVWKSLTSDPETLDMITGLSLELDCPTDHGA